MKFFQNETESVSVDGLLFDNRLDRVSISGGVDLTLDQAGFRYATDLLALIGKVHAALQAESDAGKLPASLALIPPTPAGNLFGMADSTPAKK